MRKEKKNKKVAVEEKNSKSNVNITTKVLVRYIKMNIKSLSSNCLPNVLILFSEQNKRKIRRWERIIEIWKKEEFRTVGSLWFWSVLLGRSEEAMNAVDPGVSYNIRRIVITIWFLISSNLGSQECVVLCWMLFLEFGVPSLAASTLQWWVFSACFGLQWRLSVCSSFNFEVWTGYPFSLILKRPNWDLLLAKYSSRVSGGGRNYLQFWFWVFIANECGLLLKFVFGDCICCCRC